MKRGWAALALVLVAVALSIAEAFTLDGSIRVCVDMLNEADAHMEQNEIYDALSLTERVDHRFEKEAELLDILIYHGELTEISKGLAQLRRYAQTGSTAEYLALSAGVKRSLLYLKSSRLPSLGNVF